MVAGSQDFEQNESTRSKPAWVGVWHLWTVVIPRRSIAGRLVYGRVLRRHDGRRWTYKKFVEPTNDKLIERRSVGRTAASKGALLFFSAQRGRICLRSAGRHQCRRSDQLGGLNVLPRISSCRSIIFRTVRKCRLIWRRGDFIRNRVRKLITSG